MSVYLMGAGTSADTFTLGGMEILSRADCVIYDSLADERILSFCKPDAEKIFVGKRFDRPSFIQSDINEIIKDCAKKYPVTVRLKGGDPLVFGRGGEEALFLKENGIDYSFVCGVSSSVAAPEAAGIALTHRGLSRSFTVVTASGADGKINGGMFDFVDYSGTLVVLMGLHYLKDISLGFISRGKSPRTPCAVVSNANAKNQRSVKGALEDIYELAKEARLTSPAVIIIGECVGLELSSRPKYKVAITGTRDFAKKLLLPLGNRGIDCAFFETERVESDFSDISDFEWVIFTSGNGVKYFFENVRLQGLDLRKLSGAKFACVGAATAAKLSEYGFYADFIPPKADARSLTEGLKGVPADKILFPCGEETAIKDGVVFRKVYKITADPSLRAEAEEKLNSADGIAFASASAAREILSFFKPNGQKIFCLGRSAMEETEKFGCDCLVADKSTAESLIELIENTFEK